VEQGQIEEGLAQMHQGRAARRTTGAELAQPYFLALQAEVYGKMGQREQALTLLTEALAAVHTTGERRLEADLYRLKGELTLAQSSVQRLASSVPNTQHPAPSTQSQSKVQSPKSKVPNTQHPAPSTQAEACFVKAID